MISFSKQNISGWYFILAMFVVMVLFQIVEAPVLRYQRNWLDDGQWWRILTAHWVHVNWVHLFLNAAGLLLCMTMTAPQWSIRRWLVYQFIFALGISLLFSLLNSELDWYVGYSGVLYGVFLLAAFEHYPRDKVVSLMVSIAIVIKITFEQTADIDLTTGDIIGSPVIVDAHLYGVLLAFAIALFNRVNTIVQMQQLGD